MRVWIENRSSLTRWILVPIVFIASSCLIYGTVIIASWVLSIFWREDAEFNLWVYKNIIANAVSAYCAAYFSGWTAPKFQLATTCVAASIYFLINLFLIYGILTSEGWWGSDTIITILSTSGGVILAIWMAKEDFD